MKKPGRPSFKILPNCLLKKRNEAEFTQKELANKIYSHPDLMTKKPDERSCETNYQRIERDGKTSVKFARAIAQVLAEKLKQNAKSILEFICKGDPEAPPDRIEELTAQLQTQLDSGQNEHLQRALKDGDGEDKSVDELARDLAAQIDAAHLESRQADLDVLAKITGWSVDKLLHPTGSLGYWVLTERTKFGSRDTEICLGVRDVLYRIQVAGAKWLDARSESDTRVLLSREGMWCRVTLQHPRHEMLETSFSFARCTPSSSGLSWVKPSEWDIYEIYQLEGWARNHSNFVKGFESPDVGPVNLLKLRLVLASITLSDDPDVDWDKRISRQTLFVHKGSIDDMPLEVLENFRQDGQSHDLVTDWLSDDLWDSIEPYLREIPAKSWCIPGGTVCISFCFELSVREMRLRGMSFDVAPRTGTKFVIYLAEELPSGELREVPWRPRSVQNVVERRFKENLKTYNDEIAARHRIPIQLPLTNS